jgi:hypothetical protein
LVAAERSEAAPSPLWLYFLRKPRSPYYFARLGQNTNNQSSLINAEGPVLAESIVRRPSLSHPLPVCNYTVAVGICDIHLGEKRARKVS